MLLILLVGRVEDRMGIASILQQTFGARQLDVIARDDARHHATVSGPVLLQGSCAACRRSRGPLPRQPQSQNRSP